MRRRLLVAALATTALLTACTTQISGVAGPVGGMRTDATDADLVIELAEDGNETDRIARNAAVDVLDYWAAVFPDVYGGDFGELERGFWSIDPDETADRDLPDSACLDTVEDVEENAFYCDDDSIVYDRAWMAELGEEYGPFMIAEVVAHELGHAVQARAGVDIPSIVAETQAECFAGAWTQWVAQGNARHVVVRPAELDRYLLSYLYFGDPAGSEPDEPDAHGSLFDQLSAFQQGYAEGPRACADFDEDRGYTLGSAGADRDLPFPKAVDLADRLLSAFWEQATTTGFDDAGPLGAGGVRLPEVAEGEHTGSACAGGGPEVDVEFCAADRTVRYDRRGLLEPARDEVGDFALVTLLGLPYAMAVRAQLGLSTGGQDAVDGAVCATGWLAREAFRGDIHDVAYERSTGAVDEAAVALLRYGEGDNVLPGSDESGFELVDAFRRGFAGGTCGL